MFAQDVLPCACGGPRTVVAFVTDANLTRSLLTSLGLKGLIRIGLPIATNAEFELIAVDDPYKFASAAQLSQFRRPLPSANPWPASPRLSLVALRSRSFTLALVVCEEV